jgi:hypothetical protein
MSWTESDAAHKLIRRKNAKAQGISRRKARQSKTSRSKMNAEGMEMTPDIMDYPGLPVVPDSYGTNSALTSGQGVPQWYGSAESRFDKLADKIAKQYEKKGMNPQEAREVGKKTAYKIGAAKYGKAGMAAKSRAGRMAAESSDDIRTAADLVAWADSNEGNLPLMSTMNAMGDNEYLSMIDSDDDEIDFVFLDGTMATCILDDKTLSTFVVAYESESFEAMGRYDPSENDILETKEKFQLSFPSFEMSPSSIQYLTFQQGSSNKFHSFWLAQDSSGGWYAFNAYARMGYSPKIFRITGPTSQEQAARAMQSKMNAKLRKGYSNSSKEFGLRAEMITEGLPVIPDSYGTNSALSSGQGVPQWYGSAEGQGQLRFTTGFSRTSYGDQKMHQNYEVEYEVMVGNKSWTSFSPEYHYAFRKMIEKDIKKNLKHPMSDYESALMDNKPLEMGTREIDYLGPNGEDVTIWYDATFMPNKIISETVKANDTFYEYDSLDFEAQGTGGDIDWDKTEYEYKEVELAKPFRTAFMASLGFIVAPLVALSGLAFFLGDE